MQSSYTMVPPSVLDEKLLKALLMLLGLKGLTKGLVIGSLGIAVLFLYSLVADALCEVTGSIGSLWIQSDSITRVFLVVIAVYVVKKLVPYALSLHKKGVI